MSIGVIYPELVKDSLEVILGRETGIHQISFYPRPVAKSVVIEYFQIIGDYERYMSIAQAFPEHYKPAHTSVSILKRVDGFEPLVKINDILQRGALLCIILFQ